MAAPNYDLLNNVQDLLTNPNSPVVKAVQQEMAQYEKQKGMTDEKYNQIAAAKLMEKIQAHLGGQIPDRAAAEQFDWDRRAKTLQGDKQFKGTPDEAMALVKQDSRPYANAYGAIDALRAMLPQQPTPASITEPGAPTKLAKPAAPRSMPKLRDRGAASDDEQLSEGMLHALFGLSQTANESSKPYGQDPRYAQTLDEHDLSGVSKLPWDPKLQTRDLTDADYRDSSKDEVPLVLPKVAPTPQAPAAYGASFGAPTLANSAPAPDEVPLAFPKLDVRPEDQAALARALADLQQRYK